MNKLFRALLASLLCAGLLVTVASDVIAHDAPNSCGSQSQTGAGWYDAYGHNVGCERTRRVARRWERKCITSEGCPANDSTYIGVPPGFRCRHERAGYESVRVRCVARGNRIVHFLWGS